MLNLKVALLLLLVFTSIVTATVAAFNISAPVVLHTLVNSVAISNFLLEPLGGGDPIDDPAFPHY